MSNSKHNNGGKTVAFNELINRLGRDHKMLVIKHDGYSTELRHKCRDEGVALLIVDEVHNEVDDEKWFADILGAKK